MGVVKLFAGFHMQDSMATFVNFQRFEVLVFNFVEKNVAKFAMF